MRSFRSPLVAAALVFAAVASASCNLQEPAANDGLDPPDADSLVVSPQDVSTVVDVPVTFVAPDTSVEGNPVSGPVSWAANGGQISSAGVFSARDPGTYEVRAERSGRRGRARVVVAPPGTSIVSLSIAPATLSLQPAASFTFSATGSRSDGTTVPVAVTWSATGGTITAGGTYTAGAATGSFRVIAVQQDGSLADTATVSVNSGPATVTSVEVAPGSTTLETGRSQQFSAVGRTSTGTTTSVSVTWSATGGTITTGGLYTAGSTTGSFRVIAVRQGSSMADTSSVTITTPAPTLQRIEVAPPSATVEPGATQQFAATGRMSDNSSVSVNVNWSATGGTISGTGVYTAGGTPGTFRVIAVRQGDAMADTSTVTISPPSGATLQRIEVTPPSVTLQAGGTQQFVALGRLSDNTTTAVTVTWTATGGTITTGGRFTAGTAAGVYRVIAVRQGDTMADTSTVTVTPPPPTLTAVEITPSSVSLNPSATQQFSALGRMSDGSTSAVTVTWSATGGTVSGAGLYTAGSTPGSYRVIAVRQGGTQADTSAITVVAPPPTLTAVVVTPPSVTLAAGATQQFSAVGQMSDGSTSAVTVTWSGTGGTVSGSGLYTAGSTAGTFRVIAVRQGGTQADTSSITITPPTPTLTAVEVAPTSVTLAGGATQQFTAVGRMSDGSTSAVTVTWSATGGTVSGAGLYTAGSTAGTYRVVAVRQGGTQADTSNITITVQAPTLTAVEVTPAAVTLNTGATQQFSAVGLMSDGSTSSVTVTWTATGGTITAAGSYTAGSTAGAFRAIAVQQGGTRADTSTITINAGGGATGRPNPQGLPLAASGGGSVLPNMATVASLQLATPAGGTYTDPYTGVTVLKLTASGTPTVGSHEHGYAEGGFRISQSFLVGGERYSSVLTGDGYIHDIRHSDMAVTRRVPLTINMSGEIGAAFSANPATPRILYVVSNSGSPATVNRYDTQTMSLANTGSFPWRPTRPAGASGELAWFQTQVNDTWMTAQWGGSGATAIHAFRTADGFSRSLVISADEHHLDKKLGYVYIVNRPTPVWRLSDGATFTANDPGNHIATDHSGTVGGALVGAAFWQGGGGAYYYRPDLNQTFWFITSDAGFHSASNDWYNVGHWCIDQPSDVVSEQWFIADRFLSDDGGAKIRRGMIAFVRLNGEVRLLAAHGSAGGDYQSYPQSHPAIDGRLVMWTSDMNNSGQYQVFVAKVPVS